MTLNIWRLTWDSLNCARFSDKQLGDIWGTWTARMWPLLYSRFNFCVQWSIENSTKMRLFAESVWFSRNDLCAVDKTYFPVKCTTECQVFDHLQPKSPISVKITFQYQKPSLCTTKISEKRKFWKFNRVYPIKIANTFQYSLKECSSANCISVFLGCSPFHRWLVVENCFIKANNNLENDNYWNVKHKHQLRNVNFLQNRIAFYDNWWRALIFLRVYKN